MANLAHRRKYPAALILEKSRIFQDYRRAFTRVTGLPLQIRSAFEASRSLARAGRPAGSLCALLARGNASCAACLATQARLEKRARLKARTLKCFAGLCETAIPVRVGDNLIAFLETGRVLTSPPDSPRFNKLAGTLVKWGSQIDLKKAEEAYFSTQVLSRSQYTSAVRLLEIFASHLGTCGELLLADHSDEPATVRKARAWIEDHGLEKISLAQVARTVNVSAKYFGELFSKATHMPFVEYVARVRIEKAKELLADSNLRIGDIAHAAGFGSLSQFNRAFRKYAGQSPRQYRARLPV